MNIINKKSSLAPLFGNVINSKSNTENKKIFSYKNVFNKSILWVKLYDNYLYLYLNKNTNNKFSILEPKTKENKTLATASSPALASVAGAVDNKIQISKNTIKLINKNKNNDQKEIKININKFDYKNKFLLNNNDKLQSLCLNLSKIYKKPVELELDRLHYPYYDSNILSNMIGLISNIVKLRFIIKNLFKIAKIKKSNNFINKYSIIPSYLSGFKIRVAGRLLTQRVVPRLTVKKI